MLKAYDKEKRKQDRFFIKWKGKEKKKRDKGEKKMREKKK